jgi:holo-[acyl-carrier protein] synthase
MDILGVGTEIVECLRIGRMIERHGEQFLARVYTEREVRHCQARKRAVEHFAAHWAAKEAVLRALNAGWRRGFVWTDIEARPGASTRLEVCLYGAARDLAQAQGVGGVLLSVAHCRAYAVAYALAVRGPIPTSPD